MQRCMLMSTITHTSTTRWGQDEQVFFFNATHEKKCAERPNVEGVYYRGRNGVSS